MMKTLTTVIMVHSVCTHIHYRYSNGNNNSGNNTDNCDTENESVEEVTNNENNR